MVTETAPRALADMLFRDRGINAYAMLDGARDIDMLSELVELGVRTECLMAGELEPEIFVVAPHLVQLTEDGAALKWIGGGDRAAGAVFVRSQAEILHVAAHFQALGLARLPDGRIGYLRYYDPRVLRRLLNGNSAEQRSALFGQVVTDFVLPAEPGGSLPFEVCGH